MHYFDLPIFMIRFDSHWPIRFCSSGHTNQIPPSPNQLSLSLDAVIQATPLLLVIANGAIDLLFPLFTLSFLSLNWFSLSLPFYHLITALILSYFPFFSFSIWYVLGPKGFPPPPPLPISQGHHPLNRIKSVLWVFKVWSRRRCPWQVALAGNYLRQFRVFWGIRCNGFWYSVLSEIILGCNCGCLQF